MKKIGGGDLNGGPSRSTTNKPGDGDLTGGHICGGALFGIGYKPFGGALTGGRLGGSVAAAADACGADAAV